MNRRGNKYPKDDNRGKDLFNQALNPSNGKDINNKNIKNNNNHYPVNSNLNTNTSYNNQANEYYSNQNTQNTQNSQNTLSNQYNPNRNDKNKNKREYNRKYYYNTSQEDATNINNNYQNNSNNSYYNKKEVAHNIDPEYNKEYKRIQGKLLDIEIRLEDEANKEEIDLRRELVKENLLSNYDKHMDNLKATERKECTSNSINDLKNLNIFQEIVAKNEKLMATPDLITSIVEILSSEKPDDSIQNELFDLLGYDEFDTISEFIQNRKEIKELITVVKTYLDSVEKAERANSLICSRPNASITIEHVDKEKTKKKTADLNKTHLTNLKILQQLGFDNKFLRENELLGLHEKKVVPKEIPFSNVKRVDVVQQTMNTPIQTYITESTKKVNHVEIHVKPVKTERKPTMRVAVEELPGWAQKAFNFKEFNEIQSAVFSKAFKSDENLLISAPTGAGKTNIALLTIMREISKYLTINSSGNRVNNNHSAVDFSNINWNFKIVYLVPLKALANEIVDKFKTSLAYLNLRVSEFSADVNLSKEQIDKTHLFIAIPEKWDLFTRKNDSIFTQLKLMIIDEVHLLNEDRGRVLECLVARTIRKMETNQKFIRIAGLSATLPNYWDVAEFLRVNEGLFFFDSSYRATPLKMKFFGVFERTSDHEYRDFENDIVFDEIVKYLDKGKQVLVFVHSRAETVNYAKELIRRSQMHNRTDLFVYNYNGIVKTKYHAKFMNKSLDELVPYGIGFHNAGLMRKDRNVVESLFGNKNINVLVSTSTLAWGVNLPAYAVVIKGVSYYDASKGTQVDMGILDIQQMFGRAGRPQFDKKGVAIIACPSKKVDYYVNLLKNQIEIESKLPKYLGDSLNAEIAIGNILNLSDAISWLKLTYLSIRLQGSKSSGKTSHYAALQALAEEALEKLNKFKLVRYLKFNGSLHSTELGRIACKYYMSYQTINLFYENLTEGMTDDTLLKLFARSEEFTNMKIYPDEKKELELLAERFDLVNKNTVHREDISTIAKPIILLNVYLRGAYEFKASSLHMDCAYIADNSTRIMRTILEISLHKHLVKTTFLALNYVRMVERRVAPFTTPLWQFSFESNKGKDNNSNNNFDSNEGYIPADVCRKIDSSGIYEIEDLLKEDRKILSNILGVSMPRLSDALQFAYYLPRFEVDIQTKPLTRTILNVTINLTPKFKWKKRWNHLSEPFWIIVTNGKEIIHYEYYILANKKAEQAGQANAKKSKEAPEKDTVITFAIPYQIEAGAKEANIETVYSISIFSDRWVGVDYSHYIYLNSIEVPQDQDVHTELLDLYPMPISALQNTSFEKMFASYKYFNPVQTQVFYSCYNSDENILVGAPTGSGKTVVAELAMLRVFRLKPLGKVIYVAPLKSLAKERLKDWEEKLKPLGKKVLELTGDFTPDVKMLLDADVLITTPEKWDGISRNWHHRMYVQRVALVIIDEIHLLGLERGPVLEVIVSRMRYIAEKTKSKIRFVGLSTALANSYDVATWLGINTKYDNKRPPGLFNFKPAVRPCPVTIHIEGFSEKHYCPRMGTMNKPSYNAIKEFSPVKPVLIFVSSRRQTRLTALDLISLCANDNTTFLKISNENMNYVIQTVKDENLKHTLSFGIGMHHAGLGESDRKVVEDLFYNQSIQILVATSTLAWGVNFPAHLVIIKGTEYFHPKLCTYVDMPITDVLQMIGRAGRPQYDDNAVACLFVSQDKKNFYKKFLYEPFPLESSLHKFLHDHINAEVASGTINSKQGCVDYITWTYFFRRLLKNPTYYGLKSVDARELNTFLTNLVDEVIKDLNESKMVTLHSDDSLTSTLLGYLSSFYYTSYKTGYTFEMTLKAGLNAVSLMEILCDAQEFALLPVRHNEDELNEALAKLCPYEVDSNNFDSPHIKTNLLLQSHMSRLPLPISDYLTDCKLVIDNAIRIIFFMIDIASEKGFLDTTMNLVALCQMVMQGAWLTDSSLLSLPHLAVEDINKLAKIDLVHLPELIEERKKLEEILEFVNIRLNKKEIDDIKIILERIPRVSINFRCFNVNSNTLERVYDKPIIPKEDAQLIVYLEKENKEFNNLVTHSKVNKIKTCRWFLIVGNKKTNELLAIKKFSFRGKLKRNIEFIAPRIIDDESLTVYLMSDSYLGIDQEYPVALKTINERIIKKYNLKSSDYVVDVSKAVEEEFSDRNYKVVEPERENDLKKIIDGEELDWEILTDEEQEEPVFDNW